jgi:hypothetical protein
MVWPAQRAASGVSFVLHILTAVLRVGAVAAALSTATSRSHVGLYIVGCFQLHNSNAASVRTAEPHLQKHKSCFTHQLNSTGKAMSCITAAEHAGKVCVKAAKQESPWKVNTGLVKSGYKL